MVYYSMDSYRLQGFRRSRRKHKKYDALLKKKNGGVDEVVAVPFGDERYQQYRDQVPLRLFSNLDHLDEQRRKRYHQRHKGFVRDGYFSPGHFSLKYLW